MKQYPKLIIPILLLCLCCLPADAQLLTRKKNYPYRVINEAVTVSDSYTLRNAEYTARAFARFLDKNGYIDGTFHMGSKTCSANILSPALSQNRFNNTNAIIHIEIETKGYQNKIKITCNRVKVTYPQTQLESYYNPGIVYPVNPIFDQNETMIKKETVEETFHNLTAYMNEIIKKIDWEIREFVPSSNQLTYENR